MADAGPAPWFPASFDAAVLDGGYDAGPCWNAFVNRDLIDMWKGVDWLGRADIVERYSTAMGARFARYQGRPTEPRSWSDAGNLIHHGLRLGLLAEKTGPGGERGWRLISREVMWRVEGTGYDRKAVQVRGLPPAQQAARDRKEETIAKRRATLDQTARVKANGEIERLVGSIMRYDPDTVVPARWVDGGFVPAWFQGTRLDACAGIAREAHHANELPRVRLAQWIRALKHEEVCAIGRPRSRAEERAAQSPHAEIPEDDTSALEALL